MMQQDRRINSYEKKGDVEINLIDVFCILLERKKVVLGIAIAVVALAFLYLLSVNRVYQVETTIIQTAVNEVEQLNNLAAIGQLEFKVIDNRALFLMFLGNINSRALRKEFFDKNVLEVIDSDSEQKLTPFQVNVLFKDFSERLITLQDDAGDALVGADGGDGIVLFKLEGVEQGKIGIWLDNFVQMANKKTVDDVVMMFNNSLRSKIALLNYEIKKSQEQHEFMREEQLNRLNEAYQVANKVGFDKFISTQNLNQSISLSQANIKNDREELKLSSPDYLKGTKVLLAEIDVVKNRKFGDINLIGLRKNQKQLAVLSKINTNNINFDSMVVELDAKSKVIPIRPNRKQILIVSVFIGLFCGVFYVFLMHGVANIKGRMSNDEV